MRLPLELEIFCSSPKTSHTNTFPSPKPNHCRVMFYGCVDVFSQCSVCHVHIHQMPLSVKFCGVLWLYRNISSKDFSLLFFFTQCRLQKNNQMLSSTLFAQVFHDNNVTYLVKLVKTKVCWKVVSNRWCTALPRFRRLSSVKLLSLVSLVQCHAHVTWLTSQWRVQWIHLRHCGSKVTRT